MLNTLLRLLAACVLTLGCKSDTELVGPLPEGNNVLFIGNSLTYSNDLPGMVKALALSGGVTLQVQSLTEADHALIDYLIEGSAQRVIGQGGWKHIVMQQGPTTLPICRDTLVIAVKNLDQLGKQHGAKSIVMMAWPSTSRPFDFGAVHLSAQLAANTVNGQLAPVGDAWQKILGTDKSIALYDFDGFHPGPIGTYLAALVLYERITGGDARQLPSNPAISGIPLNLTRETVTLLQNAAHEANVEANATLPLVWTPATPPVPGIRC